jgi:hypothetical protein
MSLSRRSLKRKTTEADHEGEHKDLKKVCILHTERSNCEHFTFLFNVPSPDDRLKSLQDIKDLRLIKT